MENGSISNSQIKASSLLSYPPTPLHTNLHDAKNARLNYRGAWSAASGDIEPWLQIDLVAVVTITKIATQGRFDEDYWVTNYSLSYSRDSQQFFKEYRQSAVIKVSIMCLSRLSVIQSLPVCILSLRMSL